jgi:transcriptional regulator with XRE-family HTH domain
MPSTAHPSQFGERLQALRRERKLTQIDLSARSQLSKSYVSFLESGERHPSRDAVLRLAEALGPSENRLRDELLMLAGFTPPDGLMSLPAEVKPAYSREDLKSFLHHTLQLIRQQDFTQAQQEIENGFQRFRRPAQMQTLLAHLELARGGFEQAILFQKTALQHYDLSPDEQEEGLTLVDFILNLGVMYFLWGDQALFADLEVKSNSSPLRKQAIQRYQLALETFEQGLKEAPDHLYLLDEAGRVHLNLADLLKGAQAEQHWEACITCFRQVLAHQDKHEQLPLQTLRETAAFLALAYAKCKDFNSAAMILDTLTLEAKGPWSVPYIQACVSLLSYRQRPQAPLLEQALKALGQAMRLDPTAAKAQFDQDQTRDLAPLLRHRLEDTQKVMLFDA